MKIRYKKGRSRFFLILCFLWAVILLVNVFNVETLDWTFWTYIILPVVFISIYTFEYLNQYLTIEDGMIYRNSLFPKKMELTKIKRYRKSAGDYILETEKNKLRIDPTIIDSESLKILNQVLANHHTILQE